MRDPNRIDGMLERLGVIWKKYPDMRLTQLIGNLYDRCVGEFGIGYYTEDEDALNRLEKFYMER